MQDPKFVPGRPVIVEVDALQFVKIRIHDQSGTLIFPTQNPNTIIALE